MLQLPPSPNGGRREGRALAAPVARLLKKCRRQVPQVWPNTPGPPRAMVLTGYSVLFLVRRAFWPPSSVRSEPRDRLDTSVGVSEPHAFTVRGLSVRPCSSHDAHPRPPLPAANVRDDREPSPTVQRDGRTIALIWGSRKAIYVFPKLLTEIDATEVICPTVGSAPSLRLGI